MRHPGQGTAAPTPVLPLKSRQVVSEWALSLADAGATGLVALPLVLACIGAALLLVRALARALSLPARLGTLVAVGTSICGVTAIVATAPAIDA
ncbi:MAG: hypothetical protein AVDCRST_MAG11-2920, partial [uncultured Gemmatimonadaceae bacterium]